METGPNNGSNSFVDALEATIKRTMMDLSASMPCRVIAVSDDRTTVDVEPMISMVMYSGEIVQRAPILGIPVHTLGAGGFIISFPISVGDFGWIHASDRDISLFLESLKVERPNTQRMHDMSDGRFIPDAIRGFTIAGEDSNSLVIQSKTGSVKIALNLSTNIITANGAQITEDGDVVTAAGVSLNNHVHAQGVDSDGNTQQPTEPPTI